MHQLNTERVEGAPELPPPDGEVPEPKDSKETTEDFLTSSLDGGRVSALRGCDILWDRISPWWKRAYPQGAHNLCSLLVS
ncbi:hypothetical protein NMY22_g13311 [Coprinellus aureogranulatus]|nr:hypothetical protein NMY22_g13311 [Coprinellus aureogranulatus]